MKHSKAELVFKGIWKVSCWTRLCVLPFRALSFSFFLLLHFSVSIVQVIVCLLAASCHPLPAFSSSLTILDFSQWFTWKRKWQAAPVFLPGKSHGQRGLTGYSLWGYKRVRHDLANKQQQSHQSNSASDMSD